MTVEVLLVCGSLQRRSSNRAALDVIAQVIGDEALATVTEVDAALLEAIPAFNPDREDEPTDAVIAWRALLGGADAVVVAAPEYAGSVAGALKNAFDWIVGSAELYAKPVGVVSAGTSGGANARSHLIQSLTWQGAHVVGHLGIEAPRTKSDAGGAYTDGATLDALGGLARLVASAPALDGPARIELVRTVLEPLAIAPGHIAPTH